MISEPGLFRDLAYVFLAAVVGGGLARVARQPLILGYVLGGLLISPLTPGPSVAADIHTFEQFADVGVILLMFSLGIEFSLKDLAGVKWIAILGGPLGILMTIGLAMAVGAQAGWSPTRSAVVGMAKALVTAAVILIPFFFLTRRILPPVLARVARTRSDELFLLVALAIGL